MSQLTVRSGPVWRIAPGGTSKCYLIKLLRGDRAQISNRVGRKYADRPIIVAVADLFDDRDVASAEYRQRRAVARECGISGRNVANAVNYRPSAAELAGAA